MTTLQPYTRRMLWTLTSVVLLAVILGILLNVPATAEPLRTEISFFRCLLPYPMDKTRFNVVFNQFTVLDQNGHPVKSSDGVELAKALYTQYQQDTQEAKLLTASDTRPPEQTCPIQGNTPQERANSADKMARRLNANVIIYGALSEDGKTTRLSYEFYFANPGYIEAEEISGAQSLGEPLPPLNSPFTPEELTLGSNSPYSNTTHILSNIVTGLSLYNSDDYTETLSIYNQAAQESWYNNTGKQVIYQLLGNTIVHHASTSNDLHDLPEAAGYYQEALFEDPGYRRAKIGLASVDYMLAMSNSQQIDWVKWQEAVDLYILTAGSYEQDSVGKNTVEYQTLPARIHLGLGVAYYVRGYYEQKTWWEQATSEFQWIIDDYSGYDGPRNSHIGSLTGHAFAYLGLIAWNEQDSTQAISEYTRAVDLVSPFYKAYYTSHLGSLYCQTGKTKEAANAYQEAVKFAREIGNTQEVSTFSTIFDKIKKVNCPFR